MKSKILGAMLLSSAFTAMPVFATNNSGWYAGAEAIQSNQDYQKGFGKRIFKKDPQSYAAFGGIKFSKYIGTEFGFEYQPKKTKTVTLSAGDASPGAPTLGVGQSAVLSTSIKQSHAYIGLFAESVQTKTMIGKVRFQLLIAASLTEVKAKTIPLYSDGLAITPAGSAATTRSYSKKKLIPMVKVSMINYFTDHFGMRLSANYRNMDKFKIRSTSTNSVAQIRLKDSFGVGLGLVYLCG